MKFFREILRAILMLGFALMVWMFVMEFLEQHLQKIPKPGTQQEIKKGH